jgi:hypothetical protein
MCHIPVMQRSGGPAVRRSGVPAFRRPGVPAVRRSGAMAGRLCGLRFAHRQFAPGELLEPGLFENEWNLDFVLVPGCLSRPCRRDFHKKARAALQFQI